MFEITNYIRGYLVKWFFFATLVGIGGGISAIVLMSAVDWVSGFGTRLPIFIAPAIGGAIVILIYLFDKDASGSGTRVYLNAVNSHKGEIRRRTWLTKLLASATTIGFQGSGGFEGPMLLMGGSLGNLFKSFPIINRWIDKHDRRILAVCGAAGAIGAIFRSPLGGGIFAAELLYKSSIHYEDMFPAILSSTMGFVIYSTFGTSEPLLSMPAHLPEPSNVGYFILAGLASGAASVLFMMIIHRTDKLGNWLASKGLGRILPIIGGLVTGAILFQFPEAGGAGSDFIQLLFEQSFATHFLLLLVLAKILTTSFTVAFRGSAGLVIPALFIGATTGSILSNILAADGGLGSSLVISGMSASLAATANVPIAASIMLIEMAGFQVGVAAVVGSVIGYTVGQRKIIYLTTHRETPDFRTLKEFRKKDRYFEEE